ncbi:MAG: MFS transporter [Acidobacteriota bacterium]
MSTPSPSAAPKLYGLYVAAFVDTLGVFLVLALLPYYAERFGASATQIGALVSVFAVAQTLSAPLWGRLSDRVGRRPVILAGLLLSAVAYLLFSYAGSLWMLFVSRFAQGLGGGTVSAIFAYIADAVRGEDRAERIGWVTAATSAAALLGPALGSVAGSVSPALPGLIAAGLCLVAWVLCRSMLEGGARKESLQSEERPPLLGALWGVVTAPGRQAHLLIWVYALGMFGNTALTAVAALALDRRFGVGVDDIWIFFAALAGGALVVRLLILGRTVRRLGEAAVLRLGAVCLALGLALFPFVPELVGVLATVVLMAFGTSFLFPCTTALITRAGEKGAGQLLGVQQAYGGSARILGPLLAGWALERSGLAAPFLLGAAVLAVAALAALGVRQPEPPEGAAEAA